MHNPLHFVYKLFSGPDGVIRKEMIANIIMGRPRKMRLSITLKLEPFFQYNSRLVATLTGYRPRKLKEHCRSIGGIPTKMSNNCVGLSACSSTDIE